MVANFCPQCWRLQALAGVWKMHGTRVVNVLKEGFSRPSGKCHYQKMDKTLGLTGFPLSTCSLLVTLLKLTTLKAPIEEFQSYITLMYSFWWWIFVRKWMKVRPWKEPKQNPTCKITWFLHLDYLGERSEFWTTTYFVWEKNPNNVEYFSKYYVSPLLGPKHH